MTKISDIRSIITFSSANIPQFLLPTNTPILTNQYAPRHGESMRCTTFTTSSNRPVVFFLGPVTTRPDAATTDGAR